MNKKIDSDQRSISISVVEKQNKRVSPLHCVNYDRQVVKDALFAIVSLALVLGITVWLYTL